jgi:Ca2+-binding EF-hand superfamily protein
VDAQFMAVALATYFTSSNLAGNVAVAYGFNVTDTGIGTKIVNVGSSGAAFGVSNGTDLTVMQLLLGTNGLTDQPDEILGAAKIYDTNGDGVIDAYEASLRTMANELYSAINEGGGI